jgi:sulfur-oxidizing protein SoxX
MMIRFRTQALSVAAVLASSAMLLPGAQAADGDASMVEAGKKIAFTRAQGNCLACHYIDGGEGLGTIGPPLVAMQARFPEKAKLRAQIWDATEANPETSMPPFGRHGILSEDEIDKVVEFIWTL